MKKLLQYSSAAYLLVLMLIKTMGMQIAVLDYTLHKDFISATLCENKDRPETHCAGKCYLKKQLARSSEDADSQEQKETSKNFSVDFFETNDISINPGRTESDSRNPSLSMSRHSDPFIAGIFHPPLHAAA